jgi:hypothetical protein
MKLFHPMYCALLHILTCHEGISLQFQVNAYFCVGNVLHEIISPSPNMFKPVTADANAAILSKFGEEILASYLTRVCQLYN